MFASVNDILPPYDLDSIVLFIMFYMFSGSIIWVWSTLIGNSVRIPNEVFILLQPNFHD